MRGLSAGLPLLLAAVCWAADTTPTPAQPDCGNATPSSNCAVALNLSRKDKKAAFRAFERGLKLEKSQDHEKAFHEFDEAARLQPLNAEYVAAREMTREYLAGNHLRLGATQLNAGNKNEALAEFRAALELDPKNEFAEQRVLGATGTPQVPHVPAPQLVSSADSITAKPLDGVNDFHYRGDSRGLLTAVASSFGLTVVFDESFASRRVRFDLEQADFPAAIQAASSATKSFCVAIDDKTLLAAAETPDNHRAYDRLGLRVFHVSPTAPSDLTDLMNGLRTLFELRLAGLNPSANTITLRAPPNILDAATKFMDQLDTPRPEVLLDVQILEVSHTYARNIGLHIPNQFHLFNIPAAALTALSGQNLQDLINQLIASGGINQAGNQTIAALLAQLQSQQGSIFSQPLATFGGGLTLMGLTLDQLGAVLSLDESSVQALDHVTLRASQQREATFKLGSRFPVLNASFAPISNSPAIAGVLKNQSFTAPFPSVNYEDLGLTVKAKPTIHNNNDVALDLTVQFRALGGSGVNGIPIISQREFTGGILLKDGEPAAIAGMLTESDVRSLNGLPTFARIPGFGVLTSQHSRQRAEDELMILLTPHIIQESGRTEAPEIWLSK